jgi:hypothetical protein
MIAALLSPGLRMVDSLSWRDVHLLKTEGLAVQAKLIVLDEKLLVDGLRRQLMRQGHCILLGRPKDGLSFVG